MKFLFSKVFFINILAAILLVALLFWLTFSMINSYTMHDKTITVPKLKGMTIKEAKIFIKNKPFQIQITDSVYKKDKTPGVILGQSPLFDHKVKKGRQIYLTINYLQVPHIAMPNLINLSLRQAKSVIKSYGFNLGEMSYTPSVCKNCIVDQQINGEKIQPGEQVLKNATIDLVVGSGISKEKTLAPNLIGSTWEEAEEKLNQAVLSIGAVTYDETVENKEDSLTSKVYRQTPIRAANIAISLGSSINIWLTTDSSKIDYNSPDISTDSVNTDLKGAGNSIDSTKN